MPEQALSKFGKGVRNEIRSSLVTRSSNIRTFGYLYRYSPSAVGERHKKIIMNKGTIAKAVGVGLAGVAAGTAVAALANKDTRKKVNKKIAGLIDQGQSSVDGFRQTAQDKVDKSKKLARRVAKELGNKAGKK